MTVFGHSGGGGGGGGGFLAGKQVFPVDCEAEVSQRLLEASHSNDLKSASECIVDPFVDVNFVGAVCLKVRKADVLSRDESPNEVRFEYEEFKADVTALFLAAHAGNVALVKKLLGVGADVNQKLFRGFATTAAVREDHREIFKILLKAGASQPACEEALLEASCHGCASFVEPLMGTDLIRPHIAVHALVTACCRGFVDVVDALVKCGVNVNATDRVLLRSSKPSLHANVDCTALVASVVSRQISVVRLLLQAGARTDIEVQLGAWSWDMSSGEELRVGAGLAEPYPIIWCAVEYYEASGAILNMLLQHVSSDTAHFGRTLLHHAILCGNTGAVKVLLNSGSHVESPVKTTHNTEFRPIHMAARIGFSTIVQCLTEFGCDIDARTDSGETALIICTKYKREDCLGVLAIAGADFGLVNRAGQSATSITGSDKWYHRFQQAVLHIIRAGKLPKSSNSSVFSPLMFAAKSGDVLAVKALIGQAEIDLNKQDTEGFSAAMITAMYGHVEAFRLLVYAGADVKLENKSGETAITLSRLNRNCDLFEKAMLEFALEKGIRNTGGFYALHCAARRGDLDALKLLLSRGYNVNLPDGDGYTPLMLAAQEGYACMCKLLISHGAACDAMNVKGETILSLARKSGSIDNDTICVILDELAHKLVIRGAVVWKHTKGGRGAPHRKVVKMVGPEGVLSWGNSRRRNVICREAEVGPSASFERCRRRKGDAGEAGLFRVVTTKNKEVHFVCEGGFENAKLWARGIKLVTREAILGKMPREA